MAAGRLLRVIVVGEVRLPVLQLGRAAVPCQSLSDVDVAAEAREGINRRSSVSVAALRGGRNKRRACLFASNIRNYSCYFSEVAARCRCALPEMESELYR